MKDIIVHLDGGADDATRISHAEGLLRHFPGSRLTGIYTNFLPEYAYNLTGLDGGGAISTIVELQARLERETERSLVALKERFARIGPTHEVRKLDAGSTVIGARTASLARSADLFVAKTPYRDAMSAWDAVVEAVLFNSGRSLYLVPPDCPVRSEIRTLLFAWQDTREAARASSEALDFMRLATSVHLVHVDTEGSLTPENAACDAAAHLSRHGVIVEISVLAAEPYRIARTILDEAHRVSADAIVMGAYGHSRFKEWVLGGVTRNLFETSDLPLIVAH
jgi:nucleotide-binding universal stress UspA family protein